MTTTGTFDFEKSRAALLAATTAHTTASSAMLGLYGVNPLLTAKCSTLRTAILGPEILETVSAIEKLQGELANLVAGRRKEFQAQCRAALHDFIEVTGLKRIAPPRGSAAPWVELEMQGGGYTLSGTITDFSRVEHDRPSGVSAVVYIDDGTNSESYRLWVRPQGISLEAMEPDVW